MKRASIFAALAVVGALVPAVLQAATPLLIPYQGRLTDASGTPINAAQNLTFKIYTVSSGGAAVYTETQNAVTITNGLFNVNIGGTTPLPASIFTGVDLYLGITVGADPEMSPRHRLGSTPYAMRAGIGAGVAENRSTLSFTVADETNLTDIITVTITTPAAGYIVVEGSGQAGFYGTTLANYMALQLVDAAGTALDGSHYNYSGLSGYPNTSTSYFPVSIRRVYSKAAGTYTFRFQGRKQTPDGTCYIWQPTIVATYFPDALGAVVAAPGVMVRDRAEPQIP